MGQKINPISLRIQSSNRYFNFCWYSNYYYTELLSQDLIIQKYINSIFKHIQYPSGKFFIQNSQKKIKVFIFFCSPLFSRKIRSNYFKTKYYKITNKALILGKQSLPYFKNKKTFNSKINKKNLNYKKLLFLSFFILRKYFNLFYGNFTNYFDPLGCFGDKDNEATRCLVNQVYQQSSPMSKKTSTAYTFKKSIVNLKLHKFLLYFKWNQFLHQNSLVASSAKQPNGYPTLNKVDSLLYLTRLNKKLVKPKNTKKLNFKLFKCLFYNEHKTTNDKLGASLPVNLNFLFNIFDYNNKSNNNLDLYFFFKIFTFKKHFENILSKQLDKHVNLYLIKTRDHFRSASFLAEEIVYYLKKRIPFYRIKNRIIKEVKLLPAIKGIRITCSGRVGGRSKKAQRSKKQNIQYGQTSLHVFSSRIDFSSKKVLNKFGLIGVKVWISYNE